MRSPRLFPTIPAAALGLLAAAAAGQSWAESDPEPPVFDPANFVDPTLSTNPYHPTRPGIQWVRVGTTEIGARDLPFTVMSTITDVIREIDGVKTVAMVDQSIDAGELAQVGIDYLALDKDGNVWLLGGFTEDYESGAFSNIEDAWLGGSEGGRPGILVPIEATMETPMWLIGSPDPEEEPSVGKVVEMGVTTTVAFGTFENVRAVQEGEIGAPDNEVKYYAPEVGVVLNLPKDASLHKDFFELANMIQLSPEGLDEISNIVLEIEARAREEEPEVFAVAPASYRAGQ